MPAEVFTESTIGMAMVVSFGGTLIAGELAQRSWFKAWRVTLIVTVLASVFCLVAGIDMLINGWTDPLTTADPQTMGRVAAQARGKVGIILLAIHLWPYVLTGGAGFFLYHQSSWILTVLRHDLRRWSRGRSASTSSIRR